MADTNAIRRPQSGPPIEEASCIACDAETVEGEEICRACAREMAEEARAERERDEPDARAERLLRMLEDE